VAKGDRAGVELPLSLGFAVLPELEEVLDAIVGFVAAFTLRLLVVAIRPFPLLGFGAPPSFGGTDELGAPGATEVAVGGGVGGASTGLGVYVAAVRVDAGLDTGDATGVGPKCS